MNKRIRELRKNLNLTMEKFGIRLGVGKTAISKLENGERNLTDQMFKSICREFNVSEEWLRAGTGDMFNPSPSDELENLAKKYGLTDKDYIFIEMLMKNKELLSSFEDFCLNYANALLKKTDQGHNPGKTSIDEQVEDYRRQLEAEEKRRENCQLYEKMHRKNGI